MISARACSIRPAAEDAIVARRDDRGRRPQHGHSHGLASRTAPRRPQLIADMLKQGQEIIVQIAKEPLGKKGARITSHVALPGRFLVYMPTLDHTGVSRKIASAEERSRLRHLVNDAKGSRGRRIHRTHGGSHRAARRSSHRRGIPHAHVVRDQGALRAAQGAFDSPPRPESGRAHSARFHHARFRRHLGRLRRGIHEGCRLHEPLPARDW